MMTKDDALALLDDLKRMIGEGPGGDSYGLPRAKEITRKLQWTCRNGYAKQKLGSLDTYLGIWFSARRWQKYRDGQLRGILMQDIMLVESNWPDDEA